MNPLSWQLSQFLKDKRNNHSWDYSLNIQRCMQSTYKRIEWLEIQRLQTDQFLPLFGQKWGLPELLADPEPLQLQSYGAGVGGNGALCDAQLFLQDRSIGRLLLLRWIAGLLLLLSSKHCCTQLILQKEEKYGSLECPSQNGTEMVPDLIILQLWTVFGQVNDATSPLPTRLCEMEPATNQGLSDAQQA